MIKMRIEWEYFNRFKEVEEKYLPKTGEGETLATQMVTAVSKLIYKYYNDGDVFDNTNIYLDGWANDLTSYANWLAKNIDGAKDILDKVYDVKSEDDYQELLKELADEFLGDVDYLEMLNKIEKDGSIYECDGDYKFEELEDVEE